MAQSKNKIVTSIKGQEMKVERYPVQNATKVGEKKMQAGGIEHPSARILRGRMFNSVIHNELY